jgi:hypothetical protein
MIFRNSTIGDAGLGCMGLGVLDYSQVIIMWPLARIEHRVAQGEIVNFDVRVRVIVGGAILGVLNKGVIFAANRRIEQTSLELWHLLMQHSPCSDKAMQSLETFFRFSNLRTSKSTLLGWLDHSHDL